MRQWRKKKKDDNLITQPLNVEITENPVLQVELDTTSNVEIIENPVLQVELDTTSNVEIIENPVLQVELDTTSNVDITGKVFYFIYTSVPENKIFHNILVTLFF